MTSENNSRSTDLHEETRRIWDQNAAFWDSKMSGDGNDFQRILVHPACERLLNLQAGETVLEIACGNGIFARRMAQAGAMSSPPTSVRDCANAPALTALNTASASNTAWSMPPARSR